MAVAVVERFTQEPIRPMYELSHVDDLLPYTLMMNGCRFV